MNLISIFHSIERQRILRKYTAVIIAYIVRIMILRQEKIHSYHGKNRIIHQWDMEVQNAFLQY